MGKKVNISKKPENRVLNTEQKVDQWVNNRTTDFEEQEEAKEKKRLTLDIPKSLHQKIKFKAVKEGETMANMLRKLLEKNYK